jgi:hypothetical protein
MGNTRKSHLFLFALVPIAFSFIDKDLNEYGKWLKFYGLKDEYFKQVGANISKNFEWKSYDLEIEDRKLYNNLFFYSSDSTYFLDLDSYSIILDKDSVGELTWMAGDPESKVQIVRNKDLSASTLLYFGTDSYVETAIWRNKYLFELFGFQIRNNIYIPSSWKFNLSKNTLTLWVSKKTFTARPKSYLKEVRLKPIKMK